MQTLLINSGSFDEVFQITKPYFGEYLLRTFDAPAINNDFGTTNWNLITKEVAKIMVDEMKLRKTGDILFYSDTDILLFAEPQWFKNQIGDCDIRFQYETGFGPNFGFWVARVSPEVIELFEKTYEATNTGTNSQVAFKLVSEGSKLKIGYFDTKDVWNVAVANGGKVWNGEPIDWPESMKAFHANFTIGQANKILLLKEAIKRYASSSNNPN